MGNRSIEERIIDVVVCQLGGNKDQIDRKTSFVSDLCADSLDVIELIIKFEEEFDIAIPDSEAEKILTVGQAIDYLNSALAGETLPAS